MSASESHCFETASSVLHVKALNFNWSRTWSTRSLPHIYKRDGHGLEWHCWLFRWRGPGAHIRNDL